MATCLLVTVLVIWQSRLSQPLHVASGNGQRSRSPVRPSKVSLFGRVLICPSSNYRVLWREVSYIRGAIHPCQWTPINVIDFSTKTGLAEQLRALHSSTLPNTQVSSDRSIRKDTSIISGYFLYPHVRPSCCNGGAKVSSPTTTFPQARRRWSILQTCQTTDTPWPLQGCECET